VATTISAGPDREAAQAVLAWLDSHTDWTGSRGPDNNGRLLTTTFPGGTVQTTAYDNSGRPVEIKADNTAGAHLTDFKYTYGIDATPAHDTALIHTRTDVVGDAASVGSVITYGYDPSNRLLNAAEVSGTGTPTVTYAYTYDADGNRLTDAGSTWTYNTDDSTKTVAGSTTGWARDANGNMTSTVSSGTTRAFTYNKSDQATVLTAGTTTNFAYAGTSNYTRNTTTVGTTTTTYLNGPLGLVADTDGTTTDRYERTPAGRPIGYHHGTSRYYYLTDAQGSIVRIVDNTGAPVAGYSYDPYGVLRSSTGTGTGDTTITTANPLRYTAGYRDDSGLYKMGFRYYDATLGRFTQPDPSGQEANPYLYSQANPINGTDPTGLGLFGDIGGALGHLATGLGVAATVADVIPPLEPIGAALGGLSIVTSAASTGFTCSEGATRACKGSVAGLTLGAATLGTGVAAASAGSRAVEVGSNIAGNLSDLGGEAGLYN
jgi:RHS repeat-associated protein